MTTLPAGGLPGIPDVPAMSHMTVQEMVDATPLGPILDTPVGDILQGLGIPPLPQIPPMPPLPGLPPLPQIDLTGLIKPLTDLLGGFGTGDLSAGAFDPSAIFAGLSKVLQTAMSMGTGAVKALDEVWTGTSGTAAIAKSTITTADTGKVASQGTGMSFDIQAAAAIVGAGLATVQGIIAATVAKIAGTVPLMATPAGPPLAIGFATEGLSEATAAVAFTRAQLLAPTAKMVTNGTQVPVTKAPAPSGAAQSPFAVASTVMQAVTPMVSGAAELPAMIAAPVSRMLGAAMVDPSKPDGALPGSTAFPGPGGAGGGPGATTMPAGFGGAMGGAGLGGGSGTQLSAPRTAGMPMVTEPVGLNPSQQSGRTTATTSTTGIPASMAPAAAAGTGRAGGASEEEHSVPDYLVTEDNGQRVVGSVPEVAPAVLGHEEDAREAPGPDIELRLGPPTG